jgi:tRNA U34 5-methylaminomethyl-2-thiouridine-forming methyltransferase MnmC
VTPEVVITGDGSHTVLHNGTGEHYHSTFGAITESLHVFIEKGFRQTDPGISPLYVLEVGFGTGLNALLTLIEAGKQEKIVIYDAIEPFPLPLELSTKLNYPELLGGADTRELFRRIHASPINCRKEINPVFSLFKIKGKLEQTALPAKRYHLVYFDAFSPNVQPELWGPSIFAKLFSSMLPGGILLTFCAKGRVARGMKEAGFSVEKIGGPPGKRHMLRACVEAGDSTGRSVRCDLFPA